LRVSRNNRPLKAGEEIDVGDIISDASGNLSKQELRGMEVFVEGFCNQCHKGPLFSSASNRNTIQRTYQSMIERQKKFFEGQVTTFDRGYFNNAAVASDHDTGLNNRDDFGNPLAYTEQYFQALAGRSGQVHEPLPFTQSCHFQFPYTQDQNPKFLADVLIADPAGAVSCDSALNALVPRPDLVAAALDHNHDARFTHGGSLFKTPQLYNVELTGPYMHNGGMATLEQAVDNYSRGGNFGLYNPNPDQFNPEKSSAVILLGLSAQDRSDLVAFLKSLTDERVRYERAPFDHPQLLVPNGHPGDHHQSRESTTIPGQAEDELLEIPAVGKQGRTAPLKPFDELLPSP
jgi:hypothetical protein